MDDLGNLGFVFPLFFVFLYIYVKQEAMAG